MCPRGGRPNTAHEDLMNAEFLNFPRTDWRWRCGTCSTSLDGFYFLWIANIKTVPDNGELNYAVSFRSNSKAALNIYFTEITIPECTVLALFKNTKKYQQKCLV